VSPCQIWLKSFKMRPMEIGLSPGDFVLDGDPDPPQKGGGAPPQLSTHICCGQMAGCIKMSLLMEVGLGPTPPNFRPMFIMPNTWMDQHGTWHGDRLQPRRLCVRWGPSSPFPKRRQSPLPNFRPMSVVAKRLDGSRWHLARRWALV